MHALPVSASILCALHCRLRAMSEIREPHKYASIWLIGRYAERWVSAIKMRNPNPRFYACLCTCVSVSVCSSMTMTFDDGDTIVSESSCAGTIITNWVCRRPAPQEEMDTIGVCSSIAGADRNRTLVWMVGSCTSGGKYSNVDIIPTAECMSKKHFIAFVFRY